MTKCILTTSSRTWVDTLVSNTGFVGGTVRVEHTFRATAFIRISKVFVETSARAGAILFSTNCIGSTWTWYTWVYKFYNVMSDWLTASEWIAFITVNTLAVWRVTHDSTFCILTTSTRARISTFLIDAGFVVGTVKV